MAIFANNISIAYILNNETNHQHTPDCSYHCYVFLPFRTMDLAGSITGLSYSAGLITENFSLLKTLFALLPFIACFAGVAINSNKHRYWGVVTAAIIVTGIVFFSKPDFFFETWDLSHDPELIGDQAARMEGFKVKELNIGYYASNTLMWMSLVSCIISLFHSSSTKRLNAPSTTALSAVSTAAKRASQKCIKSCKRKSRTSNQRKTSHPIPRVRSVNPSRRSLRRPHQIHAQKLNTAICRVRHALPPKANRYRPLIPATALWVMCRLPLHQQNF